MDDPKLNAAWWIDLGIDQDGFETRLVSKEIGMNILYSQYPCFHNYTIIIMWLNFDATFMTTRHNSGIYTCII